MHSMVPRYTLKQIAAGLIAAEMTICAAPVALEQPTLEEVVYVVRTKDASLPTELPGCPHTAPEARFMT